MSGNTSGAVPPAPTPASSTWRPKRLPSRKSSSQLSSRELSSLSPRPMEGLHEVGPHRS
jgi:hypothetical protein